MSCATVAGRFDARVFATSHMVHPFMFPAQHARMAGQAPNSRKQTSPLPPPIATPSFNGADGVRMSHRPGTVNPQVPVGTQRRRVDHDTNLCQDIAPRTCNIEVGCQGGTGFGGVSSNQCLYHGRIPRASNIPPTEVTCHLQHPSHQH